MTKNEMVSLLKDKYGYQDSELKGDDGNYLINRELENLIEEEEKKIEQENVKELVDEPESVEETDEPEIDEDLAFFDQGVDSIVNKKYDDKDEIMVMSGLSNTYRHKSELGRDYVFNRFGQVEKMPYSEVRRIQNQTPMVFKDGWLLILNLDVIKDFGLERQYRHVVTPKNIDKILKQDEQTVLEFTKNLPKALKTTFAEYAKKQYKNGTLDSIRVINAIEDGTGKSIKDSE